MQITAKVVPSAVVDTAFALCTDAAPTMLLTLSLFATSKRTHNIGNESKHKLSEESKKESISGDSVCSPPEKPVTAKSKPEIACH